MPWNASVYFAGYIFIMTVLSKKIWIPPNWERTRFCITFISYFSLKPDVSVITIFSIILRIIVKCFYFLFFSLTLSRRRPLQSKSMDWFLYENGLRHEKVKSTLI